MRDRQLRRIIDDFVIEALRHGRDRLASGELRQVLPDWGAGILPLHVVFPPNRHISNRVRVFVDWVADLFAEAGLRQRASKPTAQTPRQPVKAL